MAYALRADTDRAVEGPLWRALAAAPSPASVADLHVQCHGHPNAIQHRLARWVRAGLVARFDGRPKLYAMIDTIEPTPEPPSVRIDGRLQPRPRTARERLWSAIRVLKRFDLPQLLMSAGASRRSTEDYLNCLQRAGYVRCERRGNSMSGEWSRYSLARNTGPKSPRVTHRATGDGRVRELVDPNTGERCDISPGRVSLRAAAPAIVEERG